MSMKLRSKNDLPSDGLDMETLMEALFYRDEFLSIASHELKTPLTSIKLQAQVFKRNTKKENTNAYEPVNVDRMVNQIDQQTTHLIKLVNDMLDISRIRSGNLVMTKNEVDLSELMLEINALMDNPLIEMKVDRDVHFLCDRERISQVVQKLLSNAIKFGKGLPVEVKLTVKNEKIKITIKDHGEGIKQEDLSRIFHRFQRAVAASEISGLGLGLYIAREIVEAHHGKISVKSELDVGSTFCIEFTPEALS